MNSKYRVATLKEHPELKNEINELHSLGWAKFMGEDPIAIKYWNKLLMWFPEFQFILLDNKETAVACGNSIPFYWNGMEMDLPTGWDGVFEQGISDYLNNIKPNSISALAIVIHPEFQGKGLSEVMVREMKSLVKRNQFYQMVAPVRPSLKSKYPLIPMDEYVKWKRYDGKSFDPWIRTHCKTGATIMRVAKRSMEITGTVQQWKEWMDMDFPGSGKYIIPEGLVPLDIDLDSNTGVYIEPNVWLNHQLD